MKYNYQVDHPLRKLSEVYDIAAELTRRHGPYRIAVAAGQDVMCLGGLAHAKERGLVEPILIGHERRTKAVFEKLGISPANWEIIPEKDDIEATWKAAELVKNGKAEILMRGKLLARDFFRALFNPKMELINHDNLWSNIVVLEVDILDRLLLLTDCALLVKPDLPLRLKQLDNAIDFISFLGVNDPKIALLAAVETVTPGMPVSLEEAGIAKMFDRGQFSKGVIVDGPLSLDLAINPKAVEKKHMNTPVAGKADILVLNNIHVGNLLFKSMITMCGAKSASVIVGAPFPIILTSRSESPDNLLYSFSLGIMMAGAKK
jgi:phosphate butyryltransferase